MGRIAKYTDNVTANVPKELRAQIVELAAESGMSISEYCAHALDKIVQEQWKFRKSIQMTASRIEPSKSNQRKS